ncbi:hypothetical protein SERLADRAFT_463779 [Serpula lacrymans var. lacrymans S7.9]|uniref:Uncharacterized protein n=1 Tax=Serpula lacrymans var. lacrymans (strain S7.9) TaxID=578457 RepID=F8NQC9_SERL9|nr:uncharacterized protein SERLADRAFT_463779 [Serpula lacrymans var. lacrymans S7.9]EGO26589.1 hypothetical protein SERLADRAFT_463779 [Serpula lacrymans var. lacrymans S7.9]
MIQHIPPPYKQRINVAQKFRITLVTYGTWNTASSQSERFPSCLVMLHAAVTVACRQ